MVVNVEFQSAPHPKGYRSLLYKLSTSILYLSTFTFGGGHMIITLTKKKFVDEYHWTDEQGTLGLVAIAQSSPRVTAVNDAIMAGYKLAGMTGVLTSVLAAVIPPFIILSAASLLYTAFCSNLMMGQMLGGMQAGVGAVITQAAWEMGSGITKNR